MTPDIRPAPPTLTARQQEVAALVAEGLSNEEIAVRLECSYYTVRAHLRDIADRLPGEGRIRHRIYVFLSGEKAA